MQEQPSNDVELKEFPRPTCCTELEDDVELRRSSVVGSLPPGRFEDSQTSLDSPTSFAFAATLSEGFVTRTATVSKLQREHYMQSYRLHGWRSRRTWLPALPARVHAQRFVSSTLWFCLQLAVVFTDFVILVMHFDATTCQYRVMPIVVAILYTLDVSLRVYGVGVAVFCSKIRNIIEVILVLMTYSGLSLVLSCDKENPKMSKLVWVRIAWIIRTCWLATLMFRTSATVRRITGENKRRFIDPTHDFDLDLAYITPRLVSMSVPAGDFLTSLYRNPLSEVARFFETFHKGTYMIMNACPELPYQTSDFTTGVIEHFDVEDHMPAQMAQIVKFLRLGRTWTELNSNHILAVHCRGGKGRTGVFCCAWLLYTQEAEDAQDALNFFSVNRTDMHRRFQLKVQGVETPSQMRYVGYIDQMLRRQGCFFPAQIVQTETVRLQLNSIVARDLFRSPAHGPLQACVYAMAGGRQLYSSAPGTDYWELGGVTVEGDVKISIQKCSNAVSAPGEHARGDSPPNRSTKKAGKVAGVMFHFVFHTAFVGERLQLEMPFIDKACKKPKLYNSSGSVELSFLKVT